MKSICMSCKYFRIEDILSGYCRRDGKDTAGSEKQRKMVRLDDTCQQWADCGQQYYIRLGWVKAQDQNRKDHAEH